MSEQKIILYGAFDRYNYGDILIPIILGKYLEENGITNIEYCSIRNADLTSMGGFKCKRLNLGEIPTNSSIIVSGGEVVNVDWTSITSYFMGWFGNRFIRVSRLIFPRSWVNSICMKIMDGQFKFPFLIEKESICKSTHILYYGVGGVSIKSSDQLIKTTLVEADLISVRDKNANHILKSTWGIDNQLTPDIANAVSKFYPKDELLESTSKNTKAFILKNEGTYFCFQMAQQYTHGELSTIIDSLSKLILEGVPIALLPLGIVSGHEDDKILEQIYERLSSEKVFILRDIHLIDSVSLIAHSKVFTGTSLHGNITAMSYAVPHFPLNKNIPKLISYIKQWDISAVEACPDYSQIHEFYEKSTEMDVETLKVNRDTLIFHIEQNVGKVCQIISSES